MLSLVRANLFRSNMAIRAGFILSRRQSHSSSQSLKSSHTRPFILPYLKDKTPIILKYHRNRELPFNTLRDMLNIQNYGVEDLDVVYHSWLSFISMNDIDYVRSALSEEQDDDLFWRKSIKLCMSTPELSTRIIQLWNDRDLRKEFRMPLNLPETIAAAYMYHQKYLNASFIVEHFLIIPNHYISWEPLLKVALTQDGLEGIKFIASSYLTTNRKIYHDDIINILRDLNLNETYLHSWNNILISNGDYPKQSSEPLDSLFETMMKYNNFKSFKNCLGHLSKLDLPNDWLSNSTSKILAIYISKTSNQLVTLQRILTFFHNQHFDYDFWGILHKKTAIRTETLDKLSEKYGISGKSSRILKSKAGKIAEEDPKRFYEFLHSNVNDSALPHLLIETMVVSVRSSNNLPRSLELCKSLLMNSKSEQKRVYIAQKFVSECTKKIKANRLFHHAKVIERLEVFLADNGWMTDEIENSFIQFDIEILRFNSAYDRLKSLLKDPNSLITAETINSVVHMMLSSKSLLLKRKVFESENVGFEVLVLALQCQTHCNVLEPRTWEAIFKYVLKNSKYEESSTFILKITDLIQSNGRIPINSSNPNHQLRKIFSDTLLTDIVDEGFLRNRNDRWTGYKVVKDLEKKGVYVPEEVIRNKLLELIRVFHQVSVGPKKYKKILKAPRPSYDMRTTVNYINSL